MPWQVWKRNSFFVGQWVREFPRLITSLIGGKEQFYSHLLGIYQELNTCLIIFFALEFTDSGEKVFMKVFQHLILAGLGR